MREIGVTLDPMRRGSEAKALETRLRAWFVGQNEAIEQIVCTYQTYLTGLVSPGRPIGSFLFLGPTGSGKTRIVEATAESLLRSPRAMVKIDCAEFQHSHEIAKLIGSPPGYLGHRETHPILSQEMLNQHHTDSMKISFVLFDEIEKASDALWNLLLGILDKGVLTLGDNRKVEFSKAMIFMTSNLGAQEMSALISPKFGFHLSGRAAAGEGGAEPCERQQLRVRAWQPRFMSQFPAVAAKPPRKGGCRQNWRPHNWPTETQKQVSHRSSPPRRDSTLTIEAPASAIPRTAPPRPLHSRAKQPTTAQPASQPLKPQP